MSLSKEIKNTEKILKSSLDLEHHLQSKATTTTYSHGIRLKIETSQLSTTFNKKFILTLVSSGSVVSMIGDSFQSVRMVNYNL
jgi:hypothetical protein